MAKNDAAVKKYNDILERYARFETNLNVCESRGQLESVLSKYREQQKKSFFAVPGKLKENQYKDLNAAKVRVDGLISALKIKFPAPVVVVSDVSDVPVIPVVPVVSDVSDVSDVPVIPVVPDAPEQQKPKSKRPLLDPLLFTPPSVPEPVPLIDDETRRIRVLQMDEVRKRMSFLYSKHFVFSNDETCNESAATAVDHIYAKMNGLIVQFIADGKLEDFKTASKDVLTDRTSPDVKTLHEHRGWKEALINLAVFIGTLGIAHAAGTIYSSIKNKELTFFKIQVQTDSAKILNELDETAQSVVASV